MYWNLDKEFSVVIKEWKNSNFLHKFSLILKIYTRGGAIKNIIKLKVLLKLVGDSGFQIEIGEVLGIHQITVSENIIEVMDAIVATAGWMTIYLEQRNQIRHYKNDVFIRTWSYMP